MSDPSSRSGSFAAAALVLTLAGSLLWLSMLLGPVMVASGLAGARDRLRQAETLAGGGKTRDPVSATAEAVTAARRAEVGSLLAAPAFDLVRLARDLGAAIDQLPHLVRAASLSAGAAATTLDMATESLGGGNGVISKSEAGGRFELGRIDEVRQRVINVRSMLEGAERELAAVDVRALPKRFGGAIRDGERRAVKTAATLQDAEDGLALLPGLLGGDRPRTYMLGFQNPAELRGAGGAMLQFAFLELDRGRSRLIRPSTVYGVDVDRRRLSIPLPDDAWYQRGIPDSRRFGNANWSPDWPLSARLTVSYAKAADRRFRDVQFPRRVDGVIAVDPIVIQNLMPAVGPYRIKAGHRMGRKKVVQFVLYRAYGVYPIPSVRRAVLRQIVDRFYEKLVDPRRPVRLLRGMGESLRHKHMQIWLADRDEQAFVEKMGWDGAIDASRDDYLYVVQQNVGGNKLDYFARQKTEVAIRPEGSAVKVSARVGIDNRVFLPQPRWSMGDSGPLHRPMVNLYVSRRARLRGWAAPRVCPPAPGAARSPCRLEAPLPAAWIDGTPPQHLERGKKVWSATLQIPPQQATALRMDYRVARAIRTSGGRKIYRLVVQHQPKVHPERLVVRFRLPAGVTDVRAPGWRRDGRALTWERTLDEDIALEVSWRS